MGTSLLPRCAICRKPVPPRSDNAAFPFCCERCRLIDLGNWLGEAYRVPVDDAADDVDKNNEDPPAPGPGQDP